MFVAFLKYFHLMKRLSLKKKMMVREHG